jgi:hypothetical protein
VYGSGAACFSASSFDLGVTVMLLGIVGQSCWQTPHPVHPGDIRRPISPKTGVPAKPADDL